MKNVHAPRLARPSIDYEHLSDSSSSRNGSFDVSETNNNDILLDGGDGSSASMYFSCTLKLLFWSDLHDKSVDDISNPKNIEKMLFIRSIDVKMTSTNGKKGTSISDHTLCVWLEISEHRG